MVPPGTPPSPTAPAPQELRSSGVLGRDGYRTWTSSRAQAKTAAGHIYSAKDYKALLDEALATFDAMPPPRGRRTPRERLSVRAPMQRLSPKGTTPVNINEVSELAAALAGDPAKAQSLRDAWKGSDTDWRASEWASELDLGRIDTEGMLSAATNAAAYLDKRIAPLQARGKDLRADEARKLRAIANHAATLQEFVAQVRADIPGVRTHDQTRKAEMADFMNSPEFLAIAGTSGTSARHFRDGEPLSAKQSFAAYAASRGHGYGSLDAYGDDEHLSLSKYLRGALNGDWRGSETEQRAWNALSGAGAATGGILIPTSLSAQILDLARTKTRVIEAGASVIPMDSRKVDVPRWITDPTLAWRAENATVAESDPTLDKITLEAQSLAGVVRVSRELVEDTDIDSALRDAFASAFAVQLDQAALYGAGVASNQPLGVKIDPAVTKTAIATNGATPSSWDVLVDSVGRVRDANHEPTAIIYSDRSARSFAKLKAADGRYLAPPDYLDGVQRLATGNVPNNLTVGTSGATTSDIFTADWSKLAIGVRIGLTITVLNERYMTNNSDGSGGQYGFMAWWRGDIRVLRPPAFDVVTGVR